MNEEIIKESFLSHLLRPSFDKILSSIRDKASCSPTCMVSYAWPMLQQEEGLQERVLRMVDDLITCGITAHMDITMGDSNTDFSSSLPSAILESDFVILVGSPSFPSRASNPLTVTHLESTAIGTKKGINGNSIVPVLFEGRFGTSFPYGYQDTIGGRFTTSSEYLKELPGVAASILGVIQHPDVVALLTSYSKEVDTIIEKKEIMTSKQIEEATANLAIQNQYWKSRILVLLSKFSLEQLRQINGMVDVRTKKVNEYCGNIMSKITPSTMQQVTSGTSIDPAVANTQVPVGLNEIPIIGYQLKEFLGGTKRVLLLCSSIPSSVAITMNCLAHHFWATNNYSAVPVFIDLTTVSSPSESCIEETLLQHGLDLPTIMQAREERSSFLFLVTGFESCGVHTNIYMRNQMYKWPGAKAIFSVSQECKRTAPCLNYYFLPCSERSVHVPDPDAFEIVDVDNEVGQPSPAGSMPIETNSDLLPSGTVPSSPLISITKATGQLSNSQTIASVAIDSMIVEREKINQQQMDKGFLLLQDDIIRVHCHHILQQIRSLAFPQSSTDTSTPSTAFISYAWPQDPSSRYTLQQQLLRLVEDLSSANITTLLDIMQLHPGSDVKQFMKQEIAKCHTVLWIGTPDLKARIKFKDDGTPATNAAVEFSHIKAKAAAVTGTSSTPPWTIQSLLFRGTTQIAFPDEFGGLASIYHNFTNQRNYYTQLPLLVAAIFGIPPDSPSFQTLYNTYCNNIQQWEESFTSAAIQMRLHQDNAEADQFQQQTSARLQSLLSMVPSAYIKEQEDTESIKYQALLSSLSNLKQQSLSPNRPHTQALEYYVPLKGGLMQDSAVDDQFEVYDEVQSYLSSCSTKNTPLLLLGAAGAGKSLFARFLEQSLWKCWNTEDQVGAYEEGGSTVVIPIFISLPQVLSQSQSSTDIMGLIESTFEQLNFTAADIDVLKMRFQFLFILDGLDEVPLDSLPKDNFWHHTRMADWLNNNNTNNNNSYNNQVVVFCRTQQIPVIETHIGTTIWKYFSLSPSPPSETNSTQQVECFYLMPFTTTQVQQFLKGYSQSSEARQNSAWKAQDYEQHINNTRELSLLVQTPFLLKLVVGILPSLDKKYHNTALKFTSVHIYQEFAKQLFERETWKQVLQSQISLTRNLIQEFHHIAERIAQSMFASRSTLLPLQETTTWEGSDHKQQEQLLVGLPIHIVNRDIRFVHKSLQEYFIAQAWIKSIDAQNDDISASTQLSSLISANLVSQEEGILDFLSQLLHHQHAPLLLSHILASRSEKSKCQQITSSNAVSMLNASRFSFSGMDLSGISIPSANLNSATMEHCNLSCSDLSGCTLIHAWMRNANLQNCVMTSVAFGEVPKLGCSECFSLCWDHQSNRLVSAHVDNCIRVWDMTTMRQVGNPLQGHTDDVLSVAFYDGKIISGSADKTIRVWSMATMKQVGDPLKGHTNGVLSIAVTHDGKIVSGSSDGTIRVWNMATMRQIGNPLKDHTDYVRSVAVTHDGKIVSGSNDSTIRVWDIATMQQIGDTLQGHANWVDCVTVFDGKIISGSRDKTIRVWNMETMKQIGEPLQGHTSSVLSIVVHDGTIVSGGEDNTVRVWDMATMKQIGEPLQGHASCVSGVACNDGKIVSGSRDRTIRVWDMVKKKHSNPLQGHTDFVTSVAIYNDKIVSCSGDKTIRVWDMATMKQIGESFKGHTGCVGSVAIYDGKIVSGSNDITIRVWDMATMKQIGMPLRGHTGAVVSVAVHDGKIVSGSDDCTIRVWDMATMKQIGDPLQGHTKRVRSIAVTQDGKIVSSSNDIRVWDMATMMQVGDPLKDHTGYGSVAVYDGKIIRGSNDIRVWDMATMMQVGDPLEDPSGSFAITSIAAHGGKIVACSWNNTIRVWDIATMKQIGDTLQGHTSSIGSVAFQEGMIVTGSQDKTVRVWNVVGSVLQEKKILQDQNYLIHCSAQLPLCLEGANIEGVKGLTDIQVQLFSQHKAIMNPIMPPAPEKKKETQAVIKVTMDYFEYRHFIPPFTIADSFIHEKNELIRFYFLFYFDFRR